MLRARFISLQVDAVNFRPAMDGDAARVSVSVFKGTRHEEEKDVAVYTLREGEKRSAFRNLLSLE